MFVYYGLLVCILLTSGFRRKQGAKNSLYAKFRATGKKLLLPSTNWLWGEKGAGENVCGVHRLGNASCHGRNLRGEILRGVGEMLLAS